MTRGFLGIQRFEALRPAQARDLGIPEDTRGVYLSGADSVAVGSPADRAGLRSGDVITKIDGHEIRTFDDLSGTITAHKPGDTIQLEIVRAGKTITVSVTLASR